MLNTPSGSGRYRLIDTPQFTARWADAVSRGAIRPANAESLLGLIRDLLASDPYRFPQFPIADEPVDLRWFDLFPVDNRNQRVEIWYSIVEDDRAVYLVSVELIPTNQAGLPGFGA